MTSSKNPQVKVGQFWRRKRDGVLVVVRNTAGGDWQRPLDVYWQDVENPLKKGAIYEVNFLLKYEFVQ